MSSKIGAEILQIYNCAINSVKGINVIRSRISLAEGKLIISDLDGGNHIYDLKRSRLFIIAAGKAVFGLCHSFLSIVDEYNKEVSNLENVIDIRSGIINVARGLKIEDDSLLKKYNVTVNFGARNNLPDVESINATKSIIELLEKIKHEAKSGVNSMIISFISGGGSALLSFPKESLSWQEKSEFISKLAKSGCDINELNKVRRCLSLVKGGKLAKIALKDSENVHMLNLIASDVIGDSMNAIASGPTFIDHSPNPASDAIEILNKYKVTVSDKIRSLIETERALNENFPTLRNVLLVNNSTAVTAAQNEASRLGYKVIDMGTNICGEASQVGKKWAAIVKNENERLEDHCGIAWIGGGETTVTILNENCGIGGRCQEMALSFYIETFRENKNVAFLAAGTDGQDGPTPVAGCIFATVAERWKEKAENALLEHNSFAFWKKYFPGSLLNTNGPTGVNVMDIYCMIKIK